MSHLLTMSPAEQEAIRSHINAVTCPECSGVGVVLKDRTKDRATVTTTEPDIDDEIEDEWDSDVRWFMRIASVLVVLVTVLCVSCQAGAYSKRRALVEMVKQGAAPAEARCAVYGFVGEAEAVICAGVKATQ